MIFDHVSVAWGRDETFSISGEVYNVTVQDSIIGQGLETHSCGGLMQTDHGVSLFRNLYIDNKTRNPKVVSAPHLACLRSTSLSRWEVSLSKHGKETEASLLHGLERIDKKLTPSGK